ncbi:sigma-70 family RNA polymerase sigma factor [Achromobacter deleyi]|uniref:Sigma-70 family RNA polymerase sigma factor n=1 Tax=Achromobacter deleyi TaxID=1353891 RepID=A0A7T4B7I2_9BURK|nr:sigma-70 family RNA polymerase sigma factor [Achromobacter deleyi]QQB37136.1 sigma-70 family RNA polymerase sigma factor [Achromobacter deleyi]
MNEAYIASSRPLSQFLRLAVIAGVESAVQIHIERGDDLNARDARGLTPLMLSASRNKPNICKLLLSAGADQGLLDPSGRTAFEIAVAAGAEATAAILDVARTPIPPLPSSDTQTYPSPGTAAEFSSPIEVIALESTPVEAEKVAPEVAVDEIDDREFDLSGWEVEEEPTKPVANLTVLISASTVQTAITAHEPIDSSAEWNDIDAYLPALALPLTRVDDAEGRAQLRRLLLRAIREGSVPGLDVQNQSTNDDRSVNSWAEAYLTMVINDLGAEVDERFEYSNVDESFEVFIDPEETPDEEIILDEVLVAIDRAASSRHEPLQMYQRDFQRLPLLTADEEIQLAKDMEAALDDALDELAGWPDGISQTLAAGAEAIKGSRQLSSIWVGGAEVDPEPASDENLETSMLVAAEPENATAEADELGQETAVNPGKATFADALQRLAALIEANVAPRTPPHEIRQALAALRLNRRFLLELIDAPYQIAPCHGFQRAMTNFRKARDRMTTANLKLAFFQAKKYLYSGEPLDDLAQEGNIGLLKAVDRYDWRRGYRFSTYATWWIRQQIGRHIADKVRTIRIPVHIHEKIQRMERITRTFETPTNRRPTLDELAERMEMSHHKLAALQRIALDVSYIDELLTDDMKAIDIYSVPDPADVVNEMQLNRVLDRFVSSLSTKGRKEELVLRMRFGIGVQETLTLDEIGTCFDLTRERIRQIEGKALRKLRHSARTEPLARLALGLKRKEHIFVSQERAPPEADTPCIAETAPPSKSTQRNGSSKSLALGQVLAQAATLNVPVEDGREAVSGGIWVKLVATPDHQHRRLARKLLGLGFEYWPGKGYWK